MMRPRARRWWAALALALCGLGAAGALVVLAGAETPSWPRRVPTGALAIQVLTATPVEAGSPVQVGVTGAGPGDQITLTALTPVGATTVTATAGPDGDASFELTGTVTRMSGSARLLATGADSLGETRLDIVAGTPVAPVVPVVGARSIVADGADQAMAVVIPTDRLGNALADGTPIDLVRGRPGGAVELLHPVVTDQLAYSWLPSGTLAGRGMVRAGIGGVSGPTVSLDETAGPPTPFTLQTLGPVPGADSQSLVTIVSTVLADQYGNVEPNGTLVTLSWDLGVAQATTIAGVATARVQAPAQPGVLSFQATCRGTQTAIPLSVDFAPVVEAVPVTASREPGEGIVVLVGPVLGRLGAQVDDGTPVVVTATDGAGHQRAASAELVVGVARLVLPSDGLVGPLVVAASVLGATGGTEL